jgi:signal peptidase I
MKPTLEPDQCFSMKLHPNRDEIERGLVAAFRHPVTNAEFTMRIMALGGDTVQMKDGVVFLNGSPIQQTPLPSYRQIYQPEGTSQSMPRCPYRIPAIGDVCEIQMSSESIDNNQYRVLSLPMSRLDNTATYTVPENHVFVLGDNRGNAADSRLPHSAGGVGFVPIENVFGIFDEVLRSF